MRHQQVSPQRRYLDAIGNGEGFRNGPYRNRSQVGTGNQGYNPYGNQGYGAGIESPRHNGGMIDHIPDDVILRMVNPGQQLAQMGQQMGQSSLIDHGAVGSLTKVFDAGPFIEEYVEKLEGSLDYLARLLFMLYWKPKDFAKKFGTDDLPTLENKLNGVFLSYGDLVLELRQSAGDKSDY